MNVLDYVVLVIILLSALAGFRKGAIGSIVVFVGTLLVFILAFYLKNPISVILYEHLPFFKLGGMFSGITVYNILIYEAISYLITLSVLALILKLIAKITGIFNRIINSTIVLGLPSKILGLIVGAVEGYLICFLVIFVLSLVSTTSKFVNNSKYGDFILSKTPGVSSIINNTYRGVVEVYDICVKNEGKEDKSAANLESLSSLLKYKILSVESAEKLVESGKVDTKGANTVIEIYRKDQA